MSMQPGLNEAMLSVMIGESSLSQAASRYQVSKRSLYSALRFAKQAPEQRQQHLQRVKEQLMANIASIDSRLAQQTA
ncbi:helix-turn-helix domain-containing protein [Pseudoalteromonas sp. BZB3]|uniref:helix-turn-helix domain-containing protein n=1 Tax=Pseudoalteromonas sp. BZB3 TaxID=3136670 RepID=UPI0032C435C2